jgi:hypothetical protein
MRRLLTIIMGAAMVISVVGPVAGANPAREAGRLAESVARSSDPRAAFAALSAREQQAVLDFTAAVSFTTEQGVVKTASATVSSAAAAAAVQCWTWTWSRIGTNLFGFTVWKFSQKIDWCGDGIRITNVPVRTVWASDLGLWWAYHGLVGSSTAGGMGSSTYRSFVQGHLSYRPPVPALNQDNHPWLDMTAHADGRGTGSGGG